MEECPVQGDPVVKRATTPVLSKKKRKRDCVAEGKYTQILAQYHSQTGLEQILAQQTVDVRTDFTKTTRQVRIDTQHNTVLRIP